MAEMSASAFGDQGIGCDADLLAELDMEDAQLMDEQLQGVTAPVAPLNAPIAAPIAAPPMAAEPDIAAELAMPTQADVTADDFAELI
ncbi:hypothetical protein KIPB_013470 [Kipferlia bialata]|uniref:Uncharacterized protein n=1 Tax=Kipferlia bialata TaxID=797122 RepID=A0A391NYP2_9EUKA|nr:hypothetical protein KIPB_013470 [Kipferlia bialata]|eukprot:g13470.t1